MAYYLMRTDDSEKEWFWTEIQKGRLHQGWGIPGTGLLDKNGDCDFDEWYPRYRAASKEYWGSPSTKDDARKRFGILANMTSVRKGDTIVIPKMPNYQTFVITKASGEYYFDEESKGEDYFHIIPVDFRTAITVNYSSSIEARTVKTKFRAYQSAVNNVYNEDFIENVDLLFNSGSSAEEKDIDGLYSEIGDKITKQILDLIQKMNHRDVEKLVGRVFENSGYDIIQRNHFDRRGGDADLILTHKLPLISDYADEYSMKVYVQVKHKKNKDWNDIEGVLQLQKIAEGDRNSLRMLVSTADEFSEKARSLAEEHNVILINGLLFAKMSYSMM